MKDKIALSAELILVTLMIAYPVLSNYRRYILSKSKVLFTIKHNKNWVIYTAIISILTGLGTVLFISVGFASAVRGIKLGIYGWVLILAAVTYFGTLTFILNPMNAKTLFTEKGIISLNGNFFWHLIKDYKWKPTLKENTYFLIIVTNFLGANIPFLIRGLVADAADMIIISQIIDQRLKGKSGRSAA